MTTASDETRTTSARTPPCDPAQLFTQIWLTLTDLLGSAATATLLRRSLRRAALTVPELQRIEITRERFEYRFAIPPAWHQGEVPPDALRALARELQPLLIELTGPVVLNRLRSDPELSRCQVFPLEIE